MLQKAGIQTSLKLEQVTLNKGVDEKEKITK